MNENLNEKRNVVTNNQSPEILTNNIYTPAFLREQLGKFKQFLIIVHARSVWIFCDRYKLNRINITVKQISTFN